MNILVINGPNINMLGQREPGHYGDISFYELEDLIRDEAAKQGIEVDFFQSNSEGAIVDCIQQAGSYDGIILNAGAYTHTSIAIRDALLSIKAKFIEVHLSNVFAREPFRHHSYLSDIAVGVIAGFREDSYLMALNYFANGVWQ
ncbi:MAG: type II 3-dehydroquinate dehydratase [Candidatus Mucispirillum faecigallinarum]|uniref:3-dehydroquinate dehydratase n=1 Tax=Candidatus Mucispirillum faecigallinarum TaxID=2838699 RepID=A0A9D2GS95_9BACT|nr:type II 3-dehydroquinate dehydratase [Mucispirillum sp.]MDY5051862.1 type II 3-dehydroquinate dehydratase [Candidatus Mucispirillum faecigallinarum]HIZ88409.1 type II 3-dehydroquinate dehydratase [Candidatus Mucispirillum faecigallinarum]